MKKLICLCLFFGVLAMLTPAQALLGVGVKGSYYSYSGNSITGFGADIELPFIPIITSRLEIDSLSASGFTLMPVLLTGTYKIPLTPVYAGLGLGTVIYSQTGATAPTTMIYDIFVGYEQAIMPMSNVFVQAAYESMNINYSIAGVNFSTNFSGYSVKGGLRFGL